MSGSSLSQWAFSRRAREVAFITGNALKVDTSSSKALLHDLRKIDAEKLQNVARLTDYAVSLKVQI